MAAFAYAKFEAFFDRSKVIRRMDAKSRKVLSGTGAAAMKHVRRSIRPGGKKNKTSQPGEPPRWHTRGPYTLRDGIFFSYEHDTKSVVVGPIKSTVGGGRGGRLAFRLSGGAKTVPELLEKGGRITYIGRGSGRHRRRFAKPKSSLIKPRPYIAPAIPYATKVMREKMRTIDL